MAMASRVVLCGQTPGGLCSGVCPPQCHAHVSACDSQTCFGVALSVATLGRCSHEPRTCCPGAQGSENTRNSETTFCRVLSLQKHGCQPWEPQKLAVTEPGPQGRAGDSVAISQRPHGDAVYLSRGQAPPVDGQLTTCSSLSCSPLPSLALSC